MRKFAMANRFAAAFLSTGLMFLAVPAQAQEGVLMRNLLGNIGILPSEKDAIEYRERAPLVVPPGSRLPQPQERAAQRNAAWPNDPDVAARRAARADANLPATEREKYKEQRNPTLSVNELRAGRDPNQRATAPTPRGSTTYEENIGPILIGRELAAQKNAAEDLSVLAGGEPERRRLSDPPTGVRKPAAGYAVKPGAEGPRQNTDSTGQKEWAQGTVRR
jgi:hypothetical protein